MASVPGNLFRPLIQKGRWELFDNHLEWARLYGADNGRCPRRRTLYCDYNMKKYTLPQILLLQTLLGQRS